MAITLADQYYIKAMDEYPYNLEESIENLNYALSYNSEHTGALYLMGCLYMEYLDELNKAEEYFELALSINPLNYKVNCKYAELMITFRDYHKAEKLIQFTHSIRGRDIATVLRVESYLYEHKGLYIEAIRLLEKAKLNTNKYEYIEDINDDLMRVQSKKESIQKYIWTN
jgi:tetratricopeptide (TPR) repeat protein